MGEDSEASAPIVVEKKKNQQSTTNRNRSTKSITEVSIADAETDDEGVNPYKDEDFYRDGWEKLLKGKAKIRRQELLEYKHNRPMGYYTNQVTNSIISKINVRDSL